MKPVKITARVTLCCMDCGQETAVAKQEWETLKAEQIEQFGEVQGYACPTCRRKAGAPVKPAKEVPA